MVGKKAFFISDRSGFRFPLDQRVKEPGPGLVVAKSESDGIFNLVPNPQNKVQFPVDKEFIRDARPPDNAERNIKWEAATTKWEEETSKWNFI